VSGMVPEAIDTLLQLATQKRKETKVTVEYNAKGFKSHMKGVDKAHARYALLIGEDELAASSIGIDVVRYKLMITVLSAFLTAFAGTLYAQYVTYINPHTLSGVGVSLSISFMAILGGMYHMWGPVIGAAFIVLMEEGFRVFLGARFIGVSDVLYGIALICLIIFLPKGIYGTIVERKNISERR